MSPLHGWRAAASAGVVLLAAACSSSTAQPTHRFASAGDAAPLPATAPYVVMTAPSTGWAVLPSGSSWLLLRTTDGFAHVTNRTPPGVETDGGLVGAFGLDKVAVAVGAHNRLLRSPLLVGTGGTGGTGGANWVPAQLPDAVTDSRGAIALDGTAPTAVTRGGAVVSLTPTGWRTLTDARRLTGTTGVHLDAVTWANATTGWITLHGPPGRPMAFLTTDGGTTWKAVAQAAGSTVAALAPCGSGLSWMLPVIDANATVAVLHTTDAGDSWSRGSAVPLTDGAPAWACRGDRVWLVARDHGADRLLASSDAGSTWTDRGPVPTGLSDLALSAPGRGFAATQGKHPGLWTVTDDGARFTRVVLPEWVSSIGAQSGGD